MRHNRDIPETSGDISRLNWDDLRRERTFNELVYLASRGLMRADYSRIRALAELTPGGSAAEVRTLVLEAIRTLGDGPHGHATGQIFRATADSQHLATRDAARLLALRTLDNPVLSRPSSLRRSPRQSPKTGLWTAGWEWIAIRDVWLAIHSKRAEPTHAPDREPTISAKDLPVAIIAYAKQLDGERKDRAILKLRDGAGYLLHTSGLTALRRQLGDIALRAAIRQGDSLAHISILTDDLGWVEHQMGDDQTAIANISRAAALAADQLQRDPNEDVALALAKAMRHTALIEGRASLEAGQRLLAEARELLEEPPCNPSGRTGTIALAQISHAEAALLYQHGTGDPPDAELLAASLAAVEQAFETFGATNSVTRQAKAADLRVAIYQALDDSQRGQEAIVVRDQLVGMTTWRVATDKVLGT